MIWIKRILYLVLLAALLFIAFFGYTFYRAKYGLPFYETDAHDISIPSDKAAILIFSKTNGFVHGAAIKASLPAFQIMAEDNDWFIYETKDAGIFNEKQLQEFETVIWNNVSGNVLTGEQRDDFKSYIMSGGGFVGIHAAGDGSHNWDWYIDKLIDARFSHHPVKNHIQTAIMKMETTPDSTLWAGLNQQWAHDEEWYIFDDNPRKNGSTILYTIDGESIDPNGVIGPLQKDKTYGMGTDHPIVWYNHIGSGKAVYSSMGHTAESFRQQEHLKILENAIKWTGGLE